MPGVVSAALINMGIVTIWWGRGAQLREHGILRGLKLLRWTHVTAHQCKQGDIYFEGVDQHHRDLRLTVAVGQAEREAVERLVTHKLRRQPESPPSDPFDDTSAEKTKPLVPIRDGTQVTLRGVTSALSFYVVLGVVLGARPWGRPPGEFLAGAGLAIVTMFVAWMVGAMRVADAGAPLVRLELKTDWPSVLVALLVAVGGYYLVQQFTFPTTVTTVALGIFSGVGLGMLGDMMLRAQMDLCDNGIMLLRGRFVPWRAVRLLRWQRSSKGTLLVRTGWRRLKGRVPAEKCEVVERILVEKLPSEMARVARRG
jgi:hypothetical protein